jgi:hypothetical protein
VLPGEEFRKFAESDVEVSNFGRLRGHLGRIQYGHINSGGYRSTKIDGVLFTVHRLVAAVFPDLIGPQPSETHTIDHKDSDRTNNHHSNLEWVTRSEQNNRAWNNKIGSARYPGGKRIRGRKSDDEQWQEFESIEDAARRLKMFHTCISRVVNGRRPHASGYIFEKMTDPDLPNEIWKDIDTELVIKHRCKGFLESKIPQ